MRNLYCMSHPKYDGKSTPNLLCKSCCTIYVDAIKQETAAKMSDVPAKSASVTSKGEWLKPSIRKSDAKREVRK